jgi:hypothetical protein
MIGRNKGLCAAALLLALGAAPAGAGEWTVGTRIGATDLDVDGSELMSGESMSDRGLLAAGLVLAHRWPKGPVLEASTMTSFDPFPIFGFSDMHHFSLAGGWQFDLGRWWRFTPKAGMVYSELETVEEDIFSGGEPTQRFHDLVPFVEVALEGRIGGRFGIGVFHRQIMEKYGDSSTTGVSLTWTFGTLSAPR